MSKNEKPLTVADIQAKAVTDKQIADAAVALTKQPGLKGHSTVDLIKYAAAALTAAAADDDSDGAR